VKLALLRGLRGRLLLAVVLGFALALLVSVAGFNLLLRQSLSDDATRLVRERATAALAGLDTSGGQIRHRETSARRVEDSDVWIFAGGTTLEAPRASEDEQRVAALLAVGPAREADIGEEARLASAPILGDGRRLGTVVAGLSLAPYERTERRALIASLALSAVLLAVVAAAAWWVLRAALRPVARMTADAAAWSERDLDRRFNAGEPYDELTRLAATLDGLLDRIAASLRRERRFSAELSHELRTPLAKVTTEAELALRRERDPASYRESLAAIVRYAEQLTRTVDTLVAAARQEAASGGGVSDARDALRRAVEDCGPAAAEAGLALEVEAAPTPVRVGVDRDVAERILQPVIENACRYGRTRVDIGLSRADGQVLVSVRDDGPGVQAGEAERIFEPGLRGSAGGKAAGAGLGLALARRLARAVGGDVEAAEGGAGGRFTVRLPPA